MNDVDKIAVISSAKAVDDGMLCTPDITDTVEKKRTNLVNPDTDQPGKRMKATKQILLAPTACLEKVARDNDARDGGNENETDDDDDEDEEDDDDDDDKPDDESDDDDSVEEEKSIDGCKSKRTKKNTLSSEDEDNESEYEDDEEDEGESDFSEEQSPSSEETDAKSSDTEDDDDEDAWKSVEAVRRLLSKSQSRSRSRSLTPERKGTKFLIKRNKVS